MESGNNFTPTPNWMEEKYDELNKWLFDDELGYCEFGIFTNGRGSEGNVLGIFKMTNEDVRYDGDTQRLFIKHNNGSIEWVDSNNFEELCKPKILLNGNYFGTEKSFLDTLVHEMCHYFNFKDGFVPASPHGVEFKKIAKVVAAKSNGMFTVERVSTAEQMSDLRLTDKLQRKKDKRRENKQRAVTAIFRFLNDGNVYLTITSNEDLINELLATYYDCKKVVVSKDYNLISLLFKKGYSRDFSVFNYWDVTDEDFIYYLELYDTSTLQKKRKKQVFMLKTDDGIKELNFNGQKTKLYTMIKSIIPSISEEEIWDLIYDESNYKTISENKINIRKIIRESIYNTIKSKKPRI